jgi:ribosomal protein S6--L-glutamate ligase
MTIGWKEWIQLPEINIPAISAKVDTGAKTSSLHAKDMKFFEYKNQLYVNFNVFPIRGNNVIKRECVLRVLDEKIIKSSSGEKEKRPVVQTIIKIGENKWPIELNLTNRAYMGHRMLLGREALRKFAIINVGYEYYQKKMTRETVKQIYLNEFRNNL